MKVAKTLAAVMMALFFSACASLGSLPPTRPLAFDQTAALASVNAFRSEHGLPSLSANPRLMAAAAAQSAAMAARGRMDHDVAGRLPGRIERSGYRWSTTAENIGRGYASYEAAMAGWIASPGHRRNLLNPAVTDIGFAAAEDERGGRPYWTQIFAAPKPERPSGGGLVPSG